MGLYFKAKLESVIDRGTKMTNQELADLVDEKVGNEEKDPDMKLWKKNPQLGEVSYDCSDSTDWQTGRTSADIKVDWQSVEWGVNPIVQSGGKYDVRLSAVSADGNIKPGVVTCTMGVRYKTYSSVMSRTFMIDPTPVSYISFSDIRRRLKRKLTEQQQEKYYSWLLEARDEAFKQLKPGAIAKDVYAAVQSLVAKKSGTLGQGFGKTIGFQVSFGNEPCALV
jgi:nucleosome binding factor SPN SPT16 subunit